MKMKQERIHSHNKREGLKCGSLGFFIIFFNVLDKIVKGWRWRRWQGKVVEEEEEEAIK